MEGAGVLLIMKTLQRMHTHTHTHTHRLGDCPFTVAGLAQYEQTVTKNLLHCLDSQPSVQIHCQLSTVDLIQQLLTAPSYEVRWETLEYLLKFGQYKEFACDEDTEEDSPSRYD